MNGICQPSFSPATCGIRRIVRSERHSPQPATRTSTWPGPGAGTGTVVARGALAPSGHPVRTHVSYQEWNTFSLMVKRSRPGS